MTVLWSCVMLVTWSTALSQNFASRSSVVISQLGTVHISKSSWIISFHVDLQPMVEQLEALTAFAEQLSKSHTYMMAMLHRSGKGGVDYDHRGAHIRVPGENDVSLDAKNSKIGGRAEEDLSRILYENLNNLSRHELQLAQDHTIYFI